ncbi:PRC-barrel domain-containing protein [Xanthobacteraceae bacterium Astr-EGSB]|uniref:PRC-barrel domain-containing protein n=1 Tax=Astrobacterium formosum TaxID=3069710 RepID=UPI0027B3C793|nr:PRC-barrel domain-containing protein [Xanthobacteraceae bacterium Astr-EGSB]
MNRTLLATTAILMFTGSCFAQTAPQTGQSSTTKASPGANQTNNPPQSGTSGGASSSMPSQSGTQAQTGGSSTGQAGIRQVDPAAAVRLTFYSVQPADMRASNLMGSTVYNLNNENIGEVEDLIIDNGKNIKAVVVSVGGFLGIGDRNIAVQPNSLVLTEQADGSTRIVANTNKEDLKNAPAFNLAEVDKRNGGTTGSAASSTGAGTGSSGKPAGSTGTNTNR